MLGRINEIKDQLLVTNSREQDVFMRGMAHALYEVLDHKTWTEDIVLEDEDGISREELS